MPWAIFGIPLLSLLTGGAAVAGIGTGIAELAGGSGQPSQSQLLKDQQNASVAQLQQNRNAESAQATTELPGLQETGMGGLNPGYLQQQSAIESGNGNLLGTPQLQQAVQAFLGQQGGGAGGSGSNPLASLLPGLSGGSTPGVGSATNAYLGNLNNGQQQNNPFGASVFGG